MDSSDHPQRFPFTRPHRVLTQQRGAPSKTRGPDDRLGGPDPDVNPGVGGVVSDDDRWRLQVQQLDRLLAQVDDAREAVIRERRANRHFSAWTPARWALLSALEDYAAGLASAGRPMPYRMRDELAIHRQLAGSPRLSWDTSREG
jgi:hypothetical protein